jgi:hypothetical protein
MARRGDEPPPGTPPPIAYPNGKPPAPPQLATSQAEEHLVLPTVNETANHPNGSRYGIPGGKNLDGPKSPVAQAAAGTTLVVIAIVSASGLDKKLMNALKKKTPLILFGGGKAAEEEAEKFVEAQIAKHGDAGRHIVADAMNKNGTLGEYSVMKKFTDKLGGQMQAHHILEVKMADKFRLGKGVRQTS